MRLWRSITSTFFGSKSAQQISYVADIVGRYWRALTWDFQHLLGVNALDFFAAPCRCGQCLSRYGADLSVRYVSRRTWDQFVLFYEALLSWRGSYTQAMFLNDPQVIDIQANAPEDDWKPQKPQLWGWTRELDAMYYVADQVQAGRIRNPDDFRPHPRPTVPAEIERKRRKEKKVDRGVEDALARGLEAAKWNYL